MEVYLCRLVIQLQALLKTLAHLRSFCLLLANFKLDRLLTLLHLLISCMITARYTKHFIARCLAFCLEKVQIGRDMILIIRLLLLLWQTQILDINRIMSGLRLLIIIIYFMRLPLFRV